MLILVSILCVFRITVEERNPWFGVLSPGHHQWLSGHSILFVNNWMREGATNLLFGMIRNPDSIEFPSINSRVPYSSYPPGSLLPLFLLAKTRAQEVTPRFLMRFNLYNHLAIAILLCFLVFHMLGDLGAILFWRTLLSLSTALSVLLLPAPMYFFQNVWMADQAVILPVCIFLILEYEMLKRESQTESIPLLTLWLIVALWGTLTEWYFLLTLFVAFIVRLSSGKFGHKSKQLLANTIIFWSPTAAALSFFVVQLITFDQIHLLIRRGLVRAGLHPDGVSAAADFWQVFWGAHVRSGLGPLGTQIFVTGLVFLLTLLSILFWKRNESPAIGKPFVAAVRLHIVIFGGVILQLFIFRNHSVKHDFSVLKLVIPVSVGSLAVLPFLFETWLFDFLQRPSKSKRIRSVTAVSKRFRLITGLAVLLGITYSISTHHRFRQLFPEPDYNMESTGEFLHANTSFEDVVFSTVLEIPQEPPQMLSYSMKRVYKIKSLSGVLNHKDQLRDSSCVVNLLLRPSSRELAKALDIFQEQDVRVRKSPQWVLLKIPLKRYQSKFSSIHSSTY